MSNVVYMYRQCVLSCCQLSGNLHTFLNTYHQKFGNIQDYWLQAIKQATANDGYLNGCIDNYKAFNILGTRNCKSEVNIKVYPPPLGQKKKDFINIRYCGLLGKHHVFGTHIHYYAATPPQTMILIFTTKTPQPLWWCWTVESRIGYKTIND
jgi:hypothetical protein